MNNMTARLLVCLLLIVGGITGAVAGGHPDIVLSWSGKGDFGPQTPGTKTSGWQEALDYCVPAGQLPQHELYVEGGGVYEISDTIHIPSINQFTLSGGSYTLNWIGPSNKDLLFVNAAMDFHCTLSHLVYGGNGAALRFKPTTGPSGGYAVIGDAEITVSSISRPQSTPGGTGVVFDSSVAEMGNICFNIGAISGFAKGIDTVSGQRFYMNRLRCPHISSTAAAGSLVVLAGNWEENVIEVGIDGGQTVQNLTGLELNGRHNVVNITTLGGFAPYRDVVFGSSAAGNRVNIVATNDISDLLGIVTDNASTVDNVLTWAGPQQPIRSVVATAPACLYTQRLFPAMVRIAGGAVSSVKLIRGTVQVDYGTSRDDIMLGVGDKLLVTLSSNAEFQINAVKMY